MIYFTWAFRQKISCLYQYKDQVFFQILMRFVTNQPIIKQIPLPILLSNQNGTRFSTTYIEHSVETVLKKEEAANWNATWNTGSWKAEVHTAGLQGLLSCFVLSKALNLLPKSFLFVCCFKNQNWTVMQPQCQLKPIQALCVSVAVVAALQVLGPFYLPHSQSLQLSNSLARL